MPDFCLVGRGKGLGSFFYLDFFLYEIMESKLLSFLIWRTNMDTADSLGLQQHYMKKLYLRISSGYDKHAITNSYMKQIWIWQSLSKTLFLPKLWIWKKCFVAFEKLDTSNILILVKNSRYGSSLLLTKTEYMTSKINIWIWRIYLCVWGYLQTALFLDGRHRCEQLLFLLKQQISKCLIVSETERVAKCFVCNR